MAFEANEQPAIRTEPAELGPVFYIPRHLHAPADALPEPSLVCPFAAWKAAEAAAQTAGPSVGEFTYALLGAERKQRENILVPIQQNRPFCVEILACEQRLAIEPVARGRGSPKHRHVGPGQPTWLAPRHKSQP